MNLQEAIEKANVEWEENPQKKEEENQVIGKFGRLFHPDNIENLSAEEYIEFLEFRSKIK